jgi:drug/metabolite transporter (DMT)-like permease
MNYQGVALALAGTTAYNTGFVLEKRALATLPAIDVRRPLRLVRTLFTAPAWLIGFACMAVGLACQVATLALLPITIAQPLQASGIGVLILLAWFVLGERAGRRDWYRLILVATSVVLLGLSSDARSQPGTRQAAPLAMSVVVVLSVALAFALYARAYRRSGGRHRGVFAGLSAGLLYGVAGLGLKGLSSDTAHAGLASAVFEAPRSAYLYVAVGMSAVGMALFQAALQRSRASIVVPTANVAGSCYFVVFGSWLFHENLPSEPGPLMLRIAGLAATALALLVTSSRTEDPPHSPTGPTHRGDTASWRSTTGCSTFSAARSTKDPCCISPTRTRSTTPACAACIELSRISR